MSQAHPVLVLEERDGRAVIELRDVTDETIPETINGESGFHIYHVRMLTELILRQLNKIRGGQFLSEAQISNLSIASSLHDIGKSRVPRSLLDFPGRLSPLEYDLIKKHAVLGAELIQEAETEMDPEIIQSAKEIARGHHERYDGNGYPNGLKGGQIPLAAQVVSLADAFDALTSSRSYKAAFPQDVALDMIANGMCGVFDPELIGCLISVVNDKELVDIRERFERSRSVVEDAQVFEAKRVLLAGNTGYVNETFLDEAFPESHIMILGKSTLTGRDKVKVYSKEASMIEHIFDTYEFDLIVYFARELSYDAQGESDGEILRELLKAASATQKDVRVLYFSSLDGAFPNDSDRAVLTKAKEALCEYYQKKSSLNVKIVRIPYLYSGTYEEDFLYGIFQRMRRDKAVKIDAAPTARMYFLSMYDLAELVTRLSDRWKPGVGILNINDEFKLTFEELKHKLSALKPDADVELTGQASGSELESKNSAVRTEYGWFSKISILEDLESQYEDHLRRVDRTPERLWDKLRYWLSKRSLLIKVVELLALFGGMEWLIRATESAAFFSIVDFRTIFIVIMATVHGLSFGIAAAGLASLSWLAAKLMADGNLITIFYEPTNWLPFIFFFLVGALCGYGKLKNDDTIAFVKEENQLLTEKLVFTRELYQDTYYEKRDLKKQIIGSKDSFGKIFDITKNLDTVEPQRLYLKIMDTFEEVLENKSISVYSINESSAFGRLEVASRDILSEVSRSISLDTYVPVLKVLETGNVWRNTGLASGLPMYAAGVFKAGKLQLLILAWHCSTEQLSLYYVNLFKILCGLVEMSLLRAFDYTQAIHDTQYLPGTRILHAEAFEKTYENAKLLSGRKVSSYILLELDPRGRSYEEMDRILAHKIRTNDILGEGEQGTLRLLLSQATGEDLKFILPRFEGTDIGVKVLHGDEE